MLAAANVARVSDTGSGGGIGGFAYVLGDAKLTLEGVALRANKAKAFGGALAIGSQGMLAAVGLHADHNEAMQSGGVLYLDSAGDVSAFSGANCTANSALRGGVAFVSGGGALSVNGHSPPWAYSANGSAESAAACHTERKAAGTSPQCSVTEVPTFHFPKPSSATCSLFLVFVRHVPFRPSFL